MLQEGVGAPTKTIYLWMYTANHPYFASRRRPAQVFYGRLSECVSLIERRWLNKLTVGRLQEHDFHSTHLNDFCGKTLQSGK